MHGWPLYKEKARQVAICIDIYSKIRDVPYWNSDIFHTVGAKEYSCIQSLKELTRNVQVLYNCLSCSDKALDICSMTNLENKPMIKIKKITLQLF